jgi:hypothetical protein
MIIISWRVAGVLWLEEANKVPRYIAAHYFLPHHLLMLSICLLMEMLFSAVQHMILAFFLLSSLKGVLQHST